MSNRTVALVAHRYAPAIGGVERVVEALACGLTRRGLDVEVITTDPTGQLAPVEERDGVLVRRFPTVAGDSVFYVAPQLGAWLGRNASRFALIHAHSYHTPLALQAALAAKWAGRPFVFSPYFHGSGHSLLRAAKLPGPYVLAGHSTGGLIVRLYASTYPTEVAGLVLVDAIPVTMQTSLTPADWRAYYQLITERPGAFEKYVDLETIAFKTSFEQMRRAARARPLGEMPLIVL